MAFKYSVVACAVLTLCLKVNAARTAPDRPDVTGPTLIETEKAPTRNLHALTQWNIGECYNNGSPDCAAGYLAACCDPVPGDYCYRDDVIAPVGTGFSCTNPNWPTAACCPNTKG